MLSFYLGLVSLAGDSVGDSLFNAMLQLQQFLAQQIPLLQGTLQRGVQLVDQLRVVRGLCLQSLQRALLLTDLI